MARRPDTYCCRLIHRVALSASSTTLCTEIEAMPFWLNARKHLVKETVPFLRILLYVP
jgi:hypothetical protein